MMRRHPLFWLGLTLMEFPFKLFHQLMGMSKGDFESFARHVLRRLAETAPPSLIREWKLPDGSTAREVGPLVWGLSLKLDRHGKPSIVRFGNVKPTDALKTGLPLTLVGDRRPLYDLIDEGESLKLLIELPGCRKENISVNATEVTVNVRAEARHTAYAGEIKLPAPINPKAAKSTYADGLLEITLPKKFPSEAAGHPIQVE